MRHGLGRVKAVVNVVSIHASVKDATSGLVTSVSISGFNPRICKRCDYIGYAVLNIAKVSIHASVKDATL